MPTLDNAYALVVGIADYANIRKLPKVQDAEDLAAALVDPGLCGYDPKKVTVLLEKDATRDKIRTGLDALKQRCDANSTVFLYFSGHGGQIKEGANKGQYLLPVEVVYPGDDALARTAISGAEFTEALRGIPAKRLTVVLDCCHAGGIGEPRDLEPTAPVATGLSDGYLNGLKEGTGRVIISATRGTDPAYVRDGAKYGVFTGHFLEGLRGAARGDGGVIRILDLYSYVQQKVVADQPNQRPVLKVELEENYPIVLYRGGKPPAPEPIERLDDGFRYDVFLSYRQQEPDKTWVRKTLLPRLKAEGLKVFIDYIDFDLGAPIVTEMERAVVQSRYTVGVLSPNYLTSNFTDLESILSEHLGLEQSQRRFIGVMRAPCKPRLGIRARYYLDMTDDDEFDAAIARLVAQARKSPDVDKI
ncbi:MAG TPA: caspase family protein [Isosphaeraceae bacterium]|nr:caspase family protein [Isosphaeraceae bacterium]